jgi:hypothetical protein
VNRWKKITAAVGLSLAVMAAPTLVSAPAQAAEWPGDYWVLSSVEVRNKIDAPGTAGGVRADCSQWSFRVWRDGVIVIDPTSVSCEFYYLSGGKRVYTNLNAEVDWTLQYKAVNGGAYALFTSNSGRAYVGSRIDWGEGLGPIPSGRWSYHCEHCGPYMYVQLYNRANGVRWYVQIPGGAWAR